MLWRLERNSQITSGRLLNDLVVNHWSGRERQSSGGMFILNKFVSFHMGFVHFRKDSSGFVQFEQVRYIGTDACSSSEGSLPLLFSLNRRSTFHGSGVQFRKVIKVIGGQRVYA